MSVRTKELGHGNATFAGGEFTVYTVPAGKSAIIKDVLITNQTGTASVYFVYVRRPPESANHVIATGTIAANAVVECKGRFVVLEPGDKLFLLTTTVAATVGAWASGAELDGVAP